MIISNFSGLVYFCILVCMYWGILLWPDKVWAVWLPKVELLRVQLSELAWSVWSRFWVHMLGMQRKEECWCWLWGWSWLSWLWLWQELWIWSAYTGLWSFCCWISRYQWILLHSKVSAGTKGLQSISRMKLWPTNLQSKIKFVEMINQAISIDY